jgi:hypothetical protein
MTWFINCRSQAVGGSVVDPYVLEGDGARNPPMLRALRPSELQIAASGRDVLIATHGFNVSYQAGACSLGNLQAYLASQRGWGASDLFVGLLWPGDFWLPVVNYPFEGNPAMDCGRRVAAFCNQHLGTAQSVSFVSHSLGARVVLQAVMGLARRARNVCLLAAAVNRDCLVAEYTSAARNCQAITIRASHADDVLRLAYPLGDPIADLLHADHRLFTGALGYAGPPPPASPPVLSPWQIPDADEYRHGDYLPPSSGPLPVPLTPAKWQTAANFMLRSYRGQRPSWP